MSATPEPNQFRFTGGSHEPPQRLTRLQQLTLNTWRLAHAKVLREIKPNDVLPQAAICAALAILRDTSNPLALFARHDARAEEFALVATIVMPQRSRDDLHDLLDSAFLLRWLELTRNGGPEELPPLRGCGPRPLLP